MPASFKLIRLLETFFLFNFRTLPLAPAAGRPGTIAVGHLVRHSPAPAALDHSPALAAGRPSGLGTVAPHPLRLLLACLCILSGR